jgi:NAD-dependent dihydropyrimidine dehydrogenase PreA subunit
MSVIRIDLDKCIGCRNCVDICPMDVMYFDEAAHKSVICYPETCQNCGQCYMNCKGRSLGISNDTFSFAPVSVRGLTTAKVSRMIVTEPGAISELTNGILP